MRLLILTQTVDERDPFLSFFVGWLAEFSKRFERIEVVCLKQGKYTLPKNVRVHSLGKEHGTSRLKYAVRFYRYIFSLRNDYDAVLVHMNQEYVLLGALVWKMLGKKVYLWRNHQAGSIWTTLAVHLSDKVFCTSQFSYTARFKKNIRMPVGVDTTLYQPFPEISRTPASILFFARFGPAKRPEMLVEALGKIKEKNMLFSASFYGDPLPKDVAYLEKTKARAHELELDGSVRFVGGVPHAEGPAIFSAHEISVNLAASGMYDKTIFEAAACGCLVLACSKDFDAHVDPRLSFEENSLDDLTAKLEALLSLPEPDRHTLRRSLRSFAQENSLASLSRRLAEEIH